jgi:hypothetical protein
MKPRSIPSKSFPVHPIMTLYALRQRQRREINILLPATDRRDQSSLSYPKVVAEAAAAAALAEAEARKEVWASC